MGISVFKNGLGYGFWYGIKFNVFFLGCDWVIKFFIEFFENFWWDYWVKNKFCVFFLSIISNIFSLLFWVKNVKGDEN